MLIAENTIWGQNVPNMVEGLYLMDGIKGLLSLPQYSVDMLLTDPPYGTTRNYWDIPLPLEALWEAVRWAVKPNGAVLLFAQCPYDKVLGPPTLPCSAMSGCGTRSGERAFSTPTGRH